MPALYRFSSLGRLDGVSILGYALEDWSRERFVAHVDENVRSFVQIFAPDEWQRFARALAYRAGDPEYSAYEQLMLDALAGERAHFLRFDEVEWAWRILEPILQSWRSGQPDPYVAGSDGPVGQARLMERGLAWRPVERA